MNEHHETLLAFMQTQGFVWGPAPELYGGAAGFYTYGPNGTLLKRRVEEKIRTLFSTHEFFEVETPTILPAIVWEASGHLGGFTDPLVRDADGGVWRADKLLEEHYAKHDIKTPVPVHNDELLKAIKATNMQAPNGKKLLDEITNHSLMMRTTIGTEIEGYNRPETATATYLPFLRYREHFRKKLPFGVFQIGKAYRNEISPRQHLVRMREFTQAEAQLFLDPQEKEMHEQYARIKDTVLPLLSWEQQVREGEPENMSIQEAMHKKLFGSNAYAYGIHLAYTLFTSFGIPEKNIRLRQHGPEEKAFYASDAWDVELYLPSFGWTEACGIHDRTDYDLRQHAKHSKQELDIFIEERREKVIPHILEIAFGVDRPVFALMDIFYEQKSEQEGMSTFNIPYELAPVHVAVLPLQKKLSTTARNVYAMIQQQGFVAIYDETASIGKRYLRQALIGTPYCVTIDFETEENNTVTVRDRDSQAQERIPIAELETFLRSTYKR